uniref:NADH-ubiquinone oxidoreductase chain 5 n=2 Tax=Drosophila melanogaster TaxID=7227 RepID=NU5M_DROME|nr:NADH dehydrogenase subunit 5 [Drosophila melanogaster]P18932.4 RecName: Full=NADH-ubiquinone oxidoreductase chain 5; AltName: Full=NADH dehydrogenase subunit 5 [Drosophila melanogaster]AAF77251.1 NADH dehydrogenase subunit 5 [Drosophila melanogaster]ACI28562.1 NADH dehydrogenase subunit 5 [Drosophila melanogaster]ACI28575.1 NADH dehydrogenase subunit 5 [Drosophila melanogaster]ACI28588.1 NADH dehydrogenase subunit 5 [Drosophila melanogaster]ACI28601.1 NADH dehydrogenase subunit 5 [Drosophi|eukprot:YP_009047273.1 NADH dehydrogenase subunit 5 (mitochondrion) [Drosophila melanogaster]
MCSISFVNLISMSLSCFLLSLYFLLNDMIYFIEWELVSLNSMSIVMTFLFDWMSLLFMSFVLMISSLVIFYSKEYMMNDNHINRFIMLVLMFVLSMMLLIISPNLISILLGWDGLGLVSYCLVIYFQNIKSYNAGMLTALSNRIGDVALLLSIAWMLNYGSWNYIFYLEIMQNEFEMLMIGSLVMLAAMTKSAQIPFSSWLPAAMAAPTPVSALVHSSTLVTAGVYLLIRFNIILSTSWLGQLMLLLSGLTMFMAGLGANFEFDLKKIIALSTLSQLGLMMSILSMGFLKLAMFHLLTHALFKALLFMCAGAIIHNMNNSQDIRLMGGLSIHMPLTSACFNVSNLALCGMPFLAGFYSKDMILEIVSISNVNMFSFFLYYFSTGLTVSYSFRLVYYSMTGDLNCGSLNMLNDESWIMLRGMMGLLIMSIIGGSMLNWLIFPFPYMICLPIYMKLLTLFVCIVGGLFGYLISLSNLFFLNKSLFMYNLSTFLGSMWFMPYISTYGMIFYPLNYGQLVVKSFDQGWSEYFGGQHLYQKLSMYSKTLFLMHNNSLKIYLLLFVFWILILLILLFL